MRRRSRSSDARSDRGGPATGRRPPAARAQRTRAAALLPATQAQASDTGADRPMRRLSRLAALAVLLVPGLAAAQSDELWNGDTHEGTTARVLIPQAMRQRNQGGSDGAGECVIASMTTNGRY